MVRLFVPLVLKEKHYKGARRRFSTSLKWEVYKAVLCGLDIKKSFITGQELLLILLWEYLVGFYAIMSVNVDVLTDSS